MIPPVEAICRVEFELAAATEVTTVTLTLHAADALEYVPQVRVACEDKESGVGSLVVGRVDELSVIVVPAEMEAKSSGELAQSGVQGSSARTPDSPTTPRTPRSDRRRPRPLVDPPHWSPPPPLQQHALD